MLTLPEAVEAVQRDQEKSQKPLAVILAGHNGAGKSTLWYKHLSDTFQIPLVNADRMMLSILPELSDKRPLPEWATNIRDRDESWMVVAQKGVEAFVAQAMAKKVPFAMETVFSHWRVLGQGKVESKIDLIREMQRAGYYVLLFFVGLSNDQLSIARVCTRVAMGGHAVATEKLQARFPRTQKAIEKAKNIADAAILVDNSRQPAFAFTICRVQIRDRVLYDCRRQRGRRPQPILEWLKIVCPRTDV
jgi:predicted ABC-type ATPase